LRIIKEVPVCRFGSYLIELSNNEDYEALKNKMTKKGFDLFKMQVEEEIRSRFIYTYDWTYEYNQYFDDYDELLIDENDGDFLDYLYSFFDNLLEQLQELYTHIKTHYNSTVDEYKVSKVYTTKNNNIVVNIRYNLPIN